MAPAPTAYRVEDDYVINTNAALVYGEADTEGIEAPCNRVPKPIVYNDVIVAFYPSHLIANTANGKESQTETEGEEHHPETEGEEHHPEAEGEEHHSEVEGEEHHSEDEGDKSDHSLGYDTASTPHQFRSLFDKLVTSEEDQSEKEGQAAASNDVLLGWNAPEDPKIGTSSGDWGDNSVGERGNTSANNPQDLNTAVPSGSWDDTSAVPGGNASVEWDKPQDPNPAVPSTVLDVASPANGDGAAAELSTGSSEEKNEQTVSANGDALGVVSTSDVNPDVGWPEDSAPASASWPVSAQWPKQMDHFKGVTFLKSIDPTALESPVDAVSVGTLQARVKVKSAPQKEKKATFANKYERETYYVQATLQTEAAGNSGNEEMLSSSPEEASFRRLGVKIKMQPDSSSVEPYFDVVIVVTWDENDQQQSKEVVVRLTADSFRRSKVVPDQSGLPDWAHWRVIDPTENEQLVSAQLSQLPGFRDLSNAERNMLEDAAEVRLEVQGDMVHGHRIFAHPDTHFGPYNATVDRIRRVLYTDFTLCMIVTGASAFRRDLGRWACSIDAVHRSASPFLRHWASSRSLLLQKGQCLPRMVRPRVATPATILYGTFLHFLTVEALAALDAHEWEMALVSQPVKKVPARFLLIDGGGTIDAATHFSVLLNMTSTDSRWSLRPGDPIKIRIRKLNPNDVSEDYLTGKVVEQPPFAYPGDVAVLANTPKNDITGEHLPIDLRPLGELPSISQLTTADEASEAVGRCKAFLVDIHRDVDRRSVKRTVANFTRLQALVELEKNEDPLKRSVTAELLCASRLDRLPRVSLLEGMNEALVRDTFDRFGDEQKRVEPLLRAMPAGFAYIQGPAGSGKSKILEDLISLGLRDARQRGTHFRAVLVSPLNTNVDAHAIRLAEELSSTGDFIVVRLFSKSTESSIVKRESPGADLLARLQHGSLKETVRDAAREAVGELSVALSFFDWHARATYRPCRVNDKRLNESNLQWSVGWWILSYSGLLDDTPPATEKFAEIKRQVESLVTHLHHMRHGTDEQKQQEQNRWSKSDMDAFGLLLAEAQRYILSVADVIVTTPALAAEERVYHHAKPVTFVGIDEASRVSTSDFIGLLSAFPGSYTVAVGDPWQLKLVVDVPTAFGGFSAQLHVPPVVRLGIAGIETVELQEQHRYGAEVTSVLSELYYHKSLRVAKSFAYSAAAQARRARLKKKLDPKKKGNSIFLVNVQNATDQQIGPTKTRINHDTAAVALSIASMLISGFGYAAEDVQIIGPYNGEVDLLKRTLALLTAPSSNTVESHAHLAGIHVSSVDSAQGGQRPVCIVDGVVASSAGFLDRADRLLTAFSRCQEFCFFVLPVDQLQTTVKPRRPLVRVMDALKGRDACIRLQAVDDAIATTLKLAADRNDDNVEPDGEDVRDGGHEVNLEGHDEEDGEENDARVNGAGETGAGEQDAGEKDARENGAGETNAGENGAGEEDAGEEDAGENDAGETDAGENDAGEKDARENDAGEKDGGENGAGVNGAGENDAGENGAGENGAGENGAREKGNGEAYVEDDGDYEGDDGEDEDDYEDAVY
jgi:hypothetical protein